MTGFVAQEDILLGSLTPREALNFAAKLKLPATISDADKSKRVEALLASMGLSHVGNNFIGYSGNIVVLHLHHLVFFHVVFCRCCCSKQWYQARFVWR